MSITTTGRIHALHQAAGYTEQQASAINRLFAWAARNTQPRHSATSVEQTQPPPPQPLPTI